MATLGNQQHKLHSLRLTIELHIRQKLDLSSAEKHSPFKVYTAGPVVAKAAHGTSGLQSGQDLASGSFGSLPLEARQCRGVCASAAASLHVPFHPLPAATPSRFFG